MPALPTKFLKNPTRITKNQLKGRFYEIFSACIMFSALILYVRNKLLPQGLFMRTILWLDSFPESHWLKQFHEALKSEDLSDVSVRGYLYDLIVAARNHRGSGPISRPVLGQD